MIEANWVWGVIEIVLLCSLCMVGMHIFLVLGTLGWVFSVLYYGDTRAIIQLGGIVWSRSYHYDMSMIPLFILMGVWVEHAGLGKDAYDACMRWFSRMKGSLAIVSIFANAFFGAVTGSALAAVVTIGGVGLPEMKRYGYSAALRTGSIASGSMLSNLIPPSTIAVVYAILTEESVGRILIAGIIPGIILTILFSAVIYVWVSIRPNIAPMLPQDVHFTWGERFRSTFLLIPIIIIFLVLVGGIYLGWFSPTEAAGIGAVTVLIVCLAYRRLSWNGFREAIIGSSRTSGMILIILVGAFLFTGTIAQSRLHMAIIEMVEAAGLTFVPLAYIIIFIFIIAGMVLDTYAMAILFIPLFYPVLSHVAGAPPMVGVWFGTLSVVLFQLAVLTPPFAPILYITQMLDGCPTIEVIKGALPFYVATAILMVLMVQFPIIVTWLPSKMMG
ncbi:MAG: TRAP transporter large permease [Chloroflexota bacterium]